MACLPQRVGRPEVMWSAQMSDHSTFPRFLLALPVPKEAPHFSTFSFDFCPLHSHLKFRFMATQSVLFVSTRFWMREHTLSLTVVDSKTPLVPRDQCFLFSRIIGKLTPKFIYFYYQKNNFLDQSIQKIFYLFLK